MTVHDELKAALERAIEAETALAPLAALADHVKAKHRDSRPAIYGLNTDKMTKLTVGHIRAAAAVLRRKPLPEPGSTPGEIAKNMEGL